MLESLQSMATVDMSDGDAVNRMEAKAKWMACVISKPDHTLFLIQYLSTQAPVLRVNADEYTRVIQPKMAAIVTAIRSQDVAQIAQAYATYQPDILNWMIEKQVQLPQTSYLVESGLKQHDELLVSSTAAGKDSPTKTAQNTLEMRPGIRATESLACQARTCANECMRSAQITEIWVRFDCTQALQWAILSNGRRDFNYDLQLQSKSCYQRRWAVSSDYRFAVPVSGVG